MRNAMSRRPFSNVSAVQEFVSFLPNWLFCQKTEDNEEPAFIQNISQAYIGRGGEI
jgi:hypothetical protein